MPLVGVPWAIPRDAGSRLRCVAGARSCLCDLSWVAQRPQGLVSRRYDDSEARLRKGVKSGERFSLKARIPSWASREPANSFRPLKASAACPASCSVSRLNDCLRKRKAVGESARISSAYRSEEHTSELQ